MSVLDGNKNTSNQTTKYIQMIFLIFRKPDDESLGKMLATKEHSETVSVFFGSVVKFAHHLCGVICSCNDPGSAHQEILRIQIRIHIKILPHAPSKLVHRSATLCMYVCVCVCECFPSSK